ncbi:MAG: hypothetical protein ACI8X5_001816 [Planctomycetota bacterium]|jgi:hypothetical protein
MKPTTRTLALNFASILLLSVSLQASAGEEEDGGFWSEDLGTFSYTYLQAGYGYGDVTGSEEADFIDAKISIAIGDNYYLRGDFADWDNTAANTTATDIGVSFGVHGSLNESLDYILDLGYSTQEFTSAGSGLDSDGPQAGFGVRGVSPEEAVEGELRYTHRWLTPEVGSSVDEGNIHFEMMWRTFDNVGLYVGGHWPMDNNSNDTVGSYSVGLRVSL